MLTAEDLRVVLASAPLRQAHGLELPQDSLTTLAGDPGAFAHFYQQWSAQGQPRYVPPAPAETQVAVQPAAPAPVQDAAPAPVMPVPVSAPTPVPPTFAPALATAPPVPVPPSPFGPPPMAPPAQQFAPFSRDPAAAFAGGTPASPYTAAPYAASPYAASPTISPYAGANYLNSPNAVAPGGLARPGMSMMLWGFGVAVVDIVITGVSWFTAAPGGTFVVAWGAIIFGTIRGIIGTVRLTRG